MKRARIIAIMLVSCALAASCDLAGIERFNKSRALVFGVADYLTVPDLTYTDDDAQAVHDCLVYSGYDSSLFLDTNASKASIETAVRSLNASDASLIFYFSSHGDRIDGTSYIIPYDGIMDQASTYVSLAELRSWIESTGVGMYTVILDTCFSGGFVEHGSITDLWPDNFGYAYTKYPGEAVRDAFRASLEELPYLFGSCLTTGGTSKGLWISAAGRAEESWESRSNQHGIFTYYYFFLNSDPAKRRDALNAADLNKDGYIGASEAFAHTAKTIIEQWNTIPPSWNPQIDGYADTPFLPHESGLPYDYLLFMAK